MTDAVASSSTSSAGSWPVASTAAHLSPMAHFSPATDLKLLDPDTQSGLYASMVEMVRATAGDNLAMLVSDVITELAGSVVALQDRLEMRYAHRGSGRNLDYIRVELGSIPDGIDCRNGIIHRLHAELQQHKQPASAAGSEDGSTAGIV